MQVWRGLLTLTGTPSMKTSFPWVLTSVVRFWASSRINQKLCLREGLRCAEHAALLCRLGLVSAEGRCQCVPLVGYRLCQVPGCDKKLFSSTLPSGASLPARSWLNTAGIAWALIQKPQYTPISCNAQGYEATEHTSSVDTASSAGALQCDCRPARLEMAEACRS